MSWRSLGRNLRTAWLINNWTDNMGLGNSAISLTCTRVSASLQLVVG
jgi:hypothetical protein